VTAWRNERDLNETTDSGKSEAERGWCAVVAGPAGLDHCALPPGIARASRAVGIIVRRCPTGPGCSPAPARRGRPIRIEMEFPAATAATGSHCRRGVLACKQKPAPSFEGGRFHHLLPTAQVTRYRQWINAFRFVRWKWPVSGRFVPRSRDLFPAPHDMAGVPPGQPSGRVPAGVERAIGAGTEVPGRWSLVVD
jgi:hypothetical protein